MQIFISVVECSSIISPHSLIRTSGEWKAKECLIRVKWCVLHKFFKIRYVWVEKQKGGSRCDILIIKVCVEEKILVYV